MRWKTSCLFLLVLMLGVVEALGQSVSLTLQWDASISANVAGYNLYRSNSSGSYYAKVNATLIPGLSYTDTTLASGVQYYYVCTAVNTSGLESGYSNEVGYPEPSPSFQYPVRPMNLKIVMVFELPDFNKPWSG